MSEEAKEKKQSKRWDGKLKRLVCEAPQDFVAWLVTGGQFVSELSPHLQGRGIDADTLFRITVDRRRGLLHVEFQRSTDPDMPQRLWEYNHYATRKYKETPITVIICLRPECKVAASPLELFACDGRRVHHFEYDVIKLWELPTEELRRRGGKGILPLLPLTREGQRREVLDEVIEGLRPHNEKSNKELLALAHGLAALAFDDPEDQSWVRRRFAMLKDILDDTWAYRELKEEALQKGLQEGELKGRQEGELKGELKGRKEALIIIVQARFPALVQLAEEQCVHIQDPAQLQNLMQQLILVPDADEARRILLAAGGQ